MDTRKLSNLLAVLLLIALSSYAVAENLTDTESGKATVRTLQVGAVTDSGGGSFLTAFPEKIESKYFVFYSSISRPQLQRYADFSDLFLDLVKRDFVNFSVTRKVSAVILATKSEFQQFLVRELKVSSPSEYGMYIGDQNLFVTYDGSGLGTFSHEIMHFVVQTTLPECPSWAIEGVPAFFEKFYGYEEGGRLILKWGFQNPWRIQALGESISSLKMENVVRGSNDTSEKRMLSVFIYQQGKLGRFLEVVKNGDKGGFGTYVEAAFNKPMPEIDTAWQAYLRDVYVKRDQIYLLPASIYFQTAEEFAAFERENAAAFQ